MNGLKSLVIAGVSIALMAGCASTSESSKGSNASAAYPQLKVLSDKPYVWDDSISEALNVARMAQPAGVGNGMRDFADGTLATTGRVGGGERVFDAGLGLISQGVFGVVSMESLNQGVNRQLDWKPAIVMNSNLNVDDENFFIKLREHISNEVWGVLKSSGLGIELVGVGTLKSAHKNMDNKHIHNVSLLFKGDFCLKARKVDGADTLNMVEASKHFYDIPAGTSGFCSIDLRVSVPSKNSDGQLIVVSEMLSGFVFLDELIKLKESYIIFPDYFTGSNSRTSFNNKYAFVYKNNEKMLFEKK